MAPDKILKTEKETDYNYRQKDYTFSLYRYNDDPEDIIYLCNVRTMTRGKGFGNVILDLADKEARRLGYKFIYLEVLKDAWMHKWYGRHGYKDFDDRTNLKDEYQRMMKKL